eukprot:TRINITY_DN5977_c0_g2_i4.p1 TRINITY_DN5977_c0_g2~~TRINITY_DN5977_c0_g2_i4.p1  ORF type:complete len:565 (-),score=153.48 TRINITY_DN5977_c0_g2_i4:321-2015(-)
MKNNQHQKSLTETDLQVRQMYRPASRGDHTRASEQQRMESQIAALNLEYARKSEAELKVRRKSGSAKKKSPSKEGKRSRPPTGHGSTSQISVSTGARTGDLLNALLRKHSDAGRRGSKATLNLSEAFLPGKTGGSPKKAGSMTQLQKRLVKAFLSPAAGGKELTETSFWKRLGPMQRKMSRSRDGSPQMTGEPPRYYLQPEHLPSKSGGSSQPKRLRTNISETLGGDDRRKVRHPRSQISFSGYNLGGMRQTSLSAESDMEDDVADRALDNRIEQLAKQVEEIAMRPGEEVASIDAAITGVDALLAECAQRRSSVLWEKARAVNGRLLSILKNESLRKHELEEEIRNANQEKTSLNAANSKLKVRVLELAEEKRHFEAKSGELEKELAARKNRSIPAPTFDFRGLLDENEELKEAAGQLQRLVGYLKSKEVKLLKLLYAIRKEGVDIDAVYNAYAEEIQREDDDAGLMNEDSEIYMQEDQVNEDHSEEIIPLVHKEEQKQQQQKKKAEAMLTVEDDDMLTDKIENSSQRTIDAGKKAAIVTKEVEFLAPKGQKAPTKKECKSFI